MTVCWTQLLIEQGDKIFLSPHLLAQYLSLGIVPFITKTHGEIIVPHLS